MLSPTRVGPPPRCPNRWPLVDPIEGFPPAPDSSPADRSRQEMWRGGHSSRELSSLTHFLTAFVSRWCSWPPPKERHHSLLASELLLGCSGACRWWTGGHVPSSAGRIRKVRRMRIRLAPRTGRAHPVAFSGNSRRASGHQSLEIIYVCRFPSRPCRRLPFLLSLPSET